MSIFAKAISQLEPDDLQELLMSKAVENIRLEFKRDIPGKDETLKKLSSFANTYGGLMVVGAKADAKDGRIAGLSGVDVQPGYKQTVVQWCFDGISPPLQVDVSDPIAVHGNPGKVCYVVSSSESDIAPHFLNGRKGVYIRSNEFSSRFDAQLANENELRLLFERRKLVRERRGQLLERARGRFQTFIETRYAALNAGKLGIGCRFDLTVVPRFPAETLCDYSRAMSVLTSTRVDWRQVGFPRTSLGFISQHESAIVLRPGSSFSLCEANVWGMVFYATEIERHPSANGPSGIHLNHFLGQLLVFLEHAGLMLRHFGYIGPIYIEMRLQSILGVPWIYFDGNRPTAGRGSELDDAVLFSIASTSEMLQEKRDAIAIDLLQNVFFATNWADVAVDRSHLEELVKKGYDYNLWARPPKLRV